MRTVVLGLGNLLLGDEGVGVHAAQALLRSGCAGEPLVLDIGTAVLDALPALEQADRVILIDAVQAGQSPGTVYRAPIDSFLRSRCIASIHGFDIAGVLAMCGSERTPEVVVIGMEPARIEWSSELSDEAAAALPLLLEAVEEEVRRRTGPSCPA